MAEIVLTKDNFEEQVLRSDKSVLIDFWATWCGPCRMLAPVLEEIAKEFDGVIKVGKVNVDEEPELAEAFRVSSIPMLVLVRDGKIQKTVVGYRPKEDIVSLLEI